ncbi:leptin a [Alosa pseudoharengus]|uniref:leptin a n=1 Tax=Alosa pseudoharengus TaxID=34774 RepID=UPI003F887FA0
MLSSFTLLLPSLLAVLLTCHGKPLPVENMKYQIRQTSKIIKSLIEEYPISQRLSFELSDVVPGTKPIQGLGSAIDSLMAFRRIVDSLWGPKSQLSVDLSTLRGHLEREMASLQCPARTPSSFQDLDLFLKDNRTYSLTLCPAVLQRLKNYMNNLLLSLDTVKTC